jgi:peptidoglycan/LPS O-acetylase OafA/YrhL
MSQPSETKFNSDIQLLRGVAILSVLAAHVAVVLPESLVWSRYIPGHYAFFWGVDLFFCVSGYVITGSLLNMREQFQEARFSRLAGAFWFRRAFRLWPLAWIWIALSLAAAFWLNRGGAFGSIDLALRDSFAAFLHYMNFRWAWCDAGRSSCGTLFLVYWSLSLEEQFYLVLPFVYFLIPRQNRLWLIAAAFAVQLLLPRPLHSVWGLIRVDALLAGVLIAELGSHRSLQSIKRYLSALGWRRYALLPALVWMLSFIAAGSWTTHYTFSALTLVCSLLVGIASADNGMLPRGGTHRFLSYLGSRSYGTYLAHIPVMLLARESIPLLQQSMGISTSSAFWSVFVGATVALIVCVEFLFVCVETPLRNRGRTTSERILGKKSGAHRSAYILTESSTLNKLP